MDHREREADGDSGDRHVGDSVGAREHHEHEQRGQEYLDGHRGPDPVPVFEDAAERPPDRGRTVGAPAVRTETVRRTVVRRERRGDRVDRHTRHQTTDDLGNPVAHRAYGSDLADDEMAECHRRVHVTARNRADGVDEEQQRQAEGQRDAELPHVIAREDSGSDRREHQHEGADGLGRAPSEIGIVRGVRDFLRRFVFGSADRAIRFTDPVVRFSGGSLRGIGYRFTGRVAFGFHEFPSEVVVPHIRRTYLHRTPSNRLAAASFAREHTTQVASPPQRLPAPRRFRPCKYL